MKSVLLLLSASFGMTVAQIPGFGGCPDWVSQSDFDMNRFLGTWYEAERYVNIFEVGTRCVKTNYTKAVDGRYLVANEIMNRFTSVKRVLEGEIRLVIKGPESTQINVKYPNLPIPYESQFIILDTDYNSYAVMWSCSSLGIINTQNAWILTREKLPHGTTLQRAYGVLDRYRLSRTFFIKIDQNSCEIAEAEATTSPSIEQASNDGSKKPPKKNTPKKNGQTSDSQTAVTTGREDDISKPAANVTKPETIDSKRQSTQQQQSSTTTQHQLHQRQPTTTQSYFDSQNKASVLTSATGAVGRLVNEKKTEKSNNRETDKKTEKPKV